LTALPLLLVGSSQDAVLSQMEHQAQDRLRIG